MGLGKHCKLTPEEVLEIFSSKDQHKVIAGDYDISIGQVSKIKNLKVWRWVHTLDAQEKTDE